MSDKAPLEFIRDSIARMTWVDRERITPTSRLIDFGLDSVKAMDLVVELEQQYGVSIADGDLADMQSLQDLSSYVEQQRAP